MAGRFARSLELAKASWSVVEADKELLLLPVMSVATQQSASSPVSGSGMRNFDEAKTRRAPSTPTTSSSPTKGSPVSKIDASRAASARAASALRTSKSVRPTTSATPRST